MGFTSLRITTPSCEPGVRWRYVKYVKNNEKGIKDRLLSDLDEPPSSAPNIPEGLKMALDNEAYCRSAASHFNWENVMQSAISANGVLFGHVNVEEKIWVPNSHTEERVLESPEC